MAINELQFGCYTSCHETKYINKEKYTKFVSLKPYKINISCRSNRSIYLTFQFNIGDYIWLSKYHMIPDIIFRELCNNPMPSSDKYDMTFENHNDIISCAKKHSLNIEINHI